MLFNERLGNCYEKRNSWRPRAANSLGVGNLGVHRKYAVVLSSFLVLLILISYSSNLRVDATDGVFLKEYKYSYGNCEWNFTISIPKSVYDSYKAVLDSDRIQNGPASYGYLTTTRDPYIIDVAQKLNSSATEKGYSPFETESLILAFIQSLPYTSDSSSAGYDEYPRFPIETLVDDGGDCEDTSILFATIMCILGYSSIYINPPEHLAVGILGENSTSEAYWTHNNGRYYYCETTGDGFGVGVIPSEFKNQEVSLYDINLGDQFVPHEYLYTASFYNSTINPIFIVLILIVIITIAVSKSYRNRNNISTNPNSQPLPAPAQVPVESNPLRKDIPHAEMRNIPVKFFVDDQLSSTDR